MTKPISQDLSYIYQIQLLAYLLGTTILLTKKNGSGVIMGPHFICTERK